ncbi:MAG: PASTA domain-containing protein [Candidatus Zixiibacteriota bacterium]
MDRPRASRLTKAASAPAGWLDRWLPPGTRQRRLLMWIAVPLVACLILAVALDKIVMPIVTRQGAEFLLPDYTNKPVLEAQLALADLELAHEVASEEYAPGVPTGVIIRQFPRAGTKVKPGRMIKFVVSLGQKMVPIPELAGRSVRQAMLDLETAGLTMGEIQWALSDTLPERVVVFSYPAAGFEVPLGSMVNLMVNRGRASTFTYMPKLIGLTLDAAKKEIQEKGLKLGVVSRRTNENYLPETVLDQSEPEGAELDIGTEVDLVVSVIK